MMHISKGVHAAALCAYVQSVVNNVESLRLLAERDDVDEAVRSAARLALEAIDTMCMTVVAGGVYVGSGVGGADRQL